jgi:hypothetical protein
VFFIIVLYFPQSVQLLDLLREDVWLQPVKMRITQISTGTRHTSPTRCNTCQVPWSYFWGTSPCTIKVDPISDLIYHLTTYHIQQLQNLCSIQNLRTWEISQIRVRVLRTVCVKSNWWLAPSYSSSKSCSAKKRLYQRHRDSCSFTTISMISANFSEKVKRDH